MDNATRETIRRKQQEIIDQLIGRINDALSAEQAAQDA